MNGRRAVDNCELRKTRFYSHEIGLLDRVVVDSLLHSRVFILSPLERWTMLSYRWGKIELRTRTQSRAGLEEIMRDVVGFLCWVVCTAREGLHRWFSLICSHLITSSSSSWHSMPLWKSHLSVTSIESRFMFELKIGCIERRKEV